MISLEEWQKVFTEEKDEDEENFIVFCDDNPCAWLKLNGLANKDAAWISMLVVSEKYKHQGVGEFAVNFSVQYLKRRGFNEIKLHTTADNSVAIKLYEKCGFVVTERKPWVADDGTDTVLLTMRKKGMSFVKLQNKENHFNVFSKLMLPYCKELDKNIGRKTSEKTLINFARSILNMSGDKDRFVEICYDGNELIGFIYGKIDRKEHRGYVRPGWGYVMEFYVKPEYRRKGYGTEMYERLEFLFESNGVKNIWLTADPVSGEPFWSAVGFKNSGDKSHENNLNIFERKLK